jgi:hypothetical protein
VRAGALEDINWSRGWCSRRRESKVEFIVQIRVFAGCGAASLQDLQALRFRRSPVFAESKVEFNVQICVRVRPRRGFAREASSRFRVREASSKPSVRGHRRGCPRA